MSISPSGREPVRITRIATAALMGHSPPGGWSAEIRPEDSIHTLIAVHTDAGVTGFGSAFAPGPLVAAAVAQLQPLCLGMDALQPERVSETLHRHSFWFGRGGTLTHAISGIDIALWDILGRVTGLPACILLGGRYRDRVRPYCSLLMTGPDRMGERIARWRARGFRAFKIGWGPFGRAGDSRLDEAIVRAAVDALPGGGQLMVDAGASDAFWPHGLKWALRTADMLAEHGVAWFEEPLPPDALEDYVTLRRAARLPIAGGEVLTRRQSFLPFITRGALDIVQPDATKVGGLSEQRRIARMAEDFGLAYVGHGWNTALGLAADLHLAAALPGVGLVEYIGGSPYVDALTAEPFALDGDGMLAVPDRPGLGVAPDPDHVARLSPDAAALFAD
ncbi:MAG: mandelate racemase/muconate lactonizing enzyme family protein [Alphaproteobacteria bacterium]|nr:MAG: mandelate racemase/muconate lactonizing enzyme family protein [Alphaproteobacteria bacterium]